MLWAHQSPAQHPPSKKVSGLNRYSFAWNMRRLLSSISSRLSICFHASISKPEQALRYADLYSVLVLTMVTWKVQT